MFHASHMFDDSAKSRNPGEIVLSEAAGDNEQHFPDEAPNDYEDVAENMKQQILEWTRETGHRYADLIARKAAEEPIKPAQ